MQEAVKLFSGYVKHEELAEALMVTSESLGNAMRYFGVTNPNFETLEAPEIEMAISAIQNGLSTNEVADLYGIPYNPDRQFVKSKQSELNVIVNQGELDI